MFVAASYLIFELEVAARSFLGNEQEIVEQEEIPLLALEALEKKKKTQKGYIMDRFSDAIEQQVVKHEKKPSSDYVFTSSWKQEVQ